MTTQEFECNAEDLKEIKELGHGAYGYVYKMLHEPTGNIMAVKVLNGNTLNNNEKENHFRVCHSEAGNTQEV